MQWLKGGMQGLALAMLVLAVGGAKAQQASGAENGFTASVQANRVVLTKGKTTVVLEPYAPNIGRVSISRIKDDALAAPGYGILARPNVSGWRYEETPEGDAYGSSELSVMIPGPPQEHSPSKTTVEPYFNEQTKWTSQVGQRVSFFVIVGKTADELYEGPRCCRRARMGSSSQRSGTRRRPRFWM